MGLSQNHVNQIYDHIFAYGLESLKFHALVSNYRKDLFISIPLHTHTQIRSNLWFIGPFPSKYVVDLCQGPTTFFNIDFTYLMVPSRTIDGPTHHIHTSTSLLHGL